MLRAQVSRRVGLSPKEGGRGQRGRAAAGRHAHARGGEEGHGEKVALSRGEAAPCLAAVATVAARMAAVLRARVGMGFSVPIDAGGATPLHGRGDGGVRPRRAGAAAGLCGSGRFGAHEPGPLPAGPPSCAGQRLLRQQIPKKKESKRSWPMQRPRYIYICGVACLLNFFSIRPALWTLPFFLYADEQLHQRERQT